MSAAGLASSGVGRCGSGWVEGYASSWPAGGATLRQKWSRCVQTTLLVCVFAVGDVNAASELWTLWVLCGGLCRTAEPAEKNKQCGCFERFPSVQHTYTHTHTHHPRTGPVAVFTRWLRWHKTRPSFSLLCLHGRFSLKKGS